MAVIVILEDRHEERPGFLRAFSADNPDASTVCTLFGYCEAGHSFRKVSDVVADVLRAYPTAEIWRVYGYFRRPKLLKRGG